MQINQQFSLLFFFLANHVMQKIVYIVLDSILPIHHPTYTHNLKNLLVACAQNMYFSEDDEEEKAFHYKMKYFTAII